MSSLLIRPALTGENPILRRIFEQSRLHVEFDEYLDEEVFDLALIAEDPAGSAMGAIHGRLDIGFDETIAPTGLGPGPQAWIDRLGVIPSKRRRGVGKALLNRFAREAVEAGCTHVGGYPDLTSEPSERMAFFAASGLKPLKPEDPTYVIGGSLVEVISATASV
ncbi:GNAT family N-acetyltransferase [Micromonospora sp. NPDC023644]|uniref:GNAT family N-acetyltransferase n=1 Tax=Micromonospora sp. NPDC023644 TaxID=3154321 RepID=UPI0033F86912